MIRIFSQYVSPKSLLLMALEGILIVLALISGVKLRFWNDPLEFEFYTVFPDFAIQALVMMAVFQVCFYYNDLYELNTIRRRGEQLVRVGQSLGAACLLLGFLYFLVPSLLVGRGVFFITIALVVTWVMLVRIGLDTVWQATAPPQNVLILGTGELALRVAGELNRRQDLNVRLLGLIGTLPAGDEAQSGRPILGPIEDLEKIALQQRVARIVVAMQDRRDPLPIRELVKLRVAGVEIEEEHSALASLTGRVSLATVQATWFVFSGGFHRSETTAVLKRAADLAFGLAGLALSLPVMILVAIAVCLDSRGPVLYRQERVGLKGAPFELLKFRSMRVDAEDATGPQWAREHDPRVTRLGRILRKYRLDELPQFLNVIRGDMSFVGPRPERPVFVEQLRERILFYDERHSVRPGLTGWAQIRYPYGASIDDACRKLEYDLFYLKNMSFFFDCAIVFETVRTILFGQGGR